MSGRPIRARALCRDERGEPGDGHIRACGVHPAARISANGGQLIAGGDGGIGCEELRPRWQATAFAGSDSKASKRQQGVALDAVPLQDGLGRDPLKRRRAADHNVDERAREIFRAAKAKNEEMRQQWHKDMKAWRAGNPDQAEVWDAIENREVPSDLLEQLAEAAGDSAAATRAGACSTTSTLTLTQHHSFPLTYFLTYFINELID